jgi:predicted nucleic acid-binding protein
MIVVDTGVLVAAINSHDRYHRACGEFLNTVTEPLIVPAMVLTECYLLARRSHRSPKLAAVFLDALASEELSVEAPRPADFARASQLMRRYADLPLDAVDAIVVATAERLGTTRVATVDRKDFRVVVPAAGTAFDLLPARLE